MKITMLKDKIVIQYKNKVYTYDRTIKNSKVSRLINQLK